MASCVSMLTRRHPIITESIGSAATHRHCEEPLRRSNPGTTTCAGPATQTVVLRPLIGVGKAFAPPLPPNRTSGFPAYGSPVDGFLIGTVSLSARPRPGGTAGGA